MISGGEPVELTGYSHKAMVNSQFRDHKNFPNSSNTRDNENDGSAFYISDRE